MAKKETAKEEPKLKPVRLMLPDATHHELRMEAARQNKMMAALAREAVEKYLKERRDR
jgi:hypothetical protein